MLLKFSGFAMARALWIARADADRLLSTTFWTIASSSAISLLSLGAGIMVCGILGERPRLTRDFQGHKCSGAALLLLEILV